MARLLLFTMKKCQCEDGNENSLLMLTVVANTGKIKFNGKTLVIQK